MKKKYIGILSILSLLFFATSCSNFLDEESKEDVEQNDNDVYTPETVLTGVYGQFNSWDYAFSYLGITEILSDNADKGSSSTDAGGDKEILDNLTYTSSAGSFLAMWSKWYKTIGAATQSIEFTEKAGLTDKTLEARYIGEARFLRALNYFFLVRGWGAVPIQEYDLIARASTDSVYTYIEADLEYAEANLPVVSAYASKDKGRATQGSAQGLLAKVYLYQKDYQNAYDYANKVINSGEYGLLDSYINIWKAAYHNSKESIFEFQAKASDDGSVAQGMQQYSQTQGARGGNGWGWGFNTPSENLLNDYNTSGDTVRRNATIIFRNGTLWDGREVGNTENAMYNYKAYSSSAPGSDWNDKSIMYLRYAEVLLIKAEAANELGKTSEALNALNQVRTRAKLANITETDQTKLRELIWHERRLELAMEHDRWFDLNRTGEAGTVMRAAGKPFVDGKHNLFPIPNDQLTQTPTMVQNPNW